MKYFKPKSLTWWSGVVSIIGGLIQVAQSKDYASAFKNPAIIAGFGLIGLRGALPTAP